MTGIKKKYIIDIYKRIDCETPENDCRYFMQSEQTYAVSDKQAINNVRHRFLGDMYSQYKPVDISGHYDVWYEYKVREST